MMEENKRVFPRFLFSEPVEFVRPDLNSNGGVGGNISLGGMSVRTSEFVPMGVVIDLQIRLGQSPKVLWAKAQVVRIREVSEDCYEIGLKFVNDEECLKSVGEYINTSRLKFI